MSIEHRDDLDARLVRLEADARALLDDMRKARDAARPGHKVRIRRECTLVEQAVWKIREATGWSL